MEFAYLHIFYTKGFSDNKADFFINSILIMFILRPIVLRSSRQCS